MSDAAAGDGWLRAATCAHCTTACNSIIALLEQPLFYVS
jgi:hypothetical protein